MVEFDGARVLQQYVITFNVIYEMSIDYTVYDITLAYIARHKMEYLY